LACPYTSITPPSSLSLLSLLEARAIDRSMSGSPCFSEQWRPEALTLAAFLYLDRHSMARQTPLLTVLHPFACPALDLCTPSGSEEPGLLLPPARPATYYYCSSTIRPSPTLFFLSLFSSRARVPTNTTNQCNHPWRRHRLDPRLDSFQLYIFQPW
jgi:hypothetical protein